jgi:hypothetical protein
MLRNKVDLINFLSFHGMNQISFIVKEVIGNIP